MYEKWHKQTKFMEGCTNIWKKLSESKLSLPNSILLFFVSHDAFVPSVVRKAQNSLISSESRLACSWSWHWDRPDQKRRMCWRRSRCLLELFRLFTALIPISVVKHTEVWRCHNIKKHYSVPCCKVLRFLPPNVYLEPCNACFRAWHLA